MIGVALQSYPVIEPMPFLSEVAKMATVDDSASFSQFEDGQTMLGLIAAHRVFGVTDELLVWSMEYYNTLLGL